MKRTLSNSDAAATQPCAQNSDRPPASSASVSIAAASDPHEIAQSHGRIGTRICGKWELTELIGVGGMGAVYAAVHNNGKHVAIKLMHPEQAHSREARERFLAEGYSANKVAHRGTPSAMDDGITEDGSPFLVMDLLIGRTLGRIVRDEGVVEPVQLLGWMEQLLDVLGAAHNKGIVHRDVKPENVMVTREGQVYLLDFGIALVPSAPETEPLRGRSTLGTPDYIPPEQALGMWQDIDGRTDLWAAGATMFWALSGRRVKPSDGSDENPSGAVTKPVRSLASAAPNLDAGIVAIVDRALQFKKEARWDSARSMSQAIHEVLVRLGQGSRAQLPPRVNVEVRSAFQRADTSSPSRGALPPSNSPAQVHPVRSELRLPFGLGTVAWALIALMATLLVIAATWLLTSLLAARGDATAMKNDARTHHLDNGSRGRRGGAGARTSCVVASRLHPLDVIVASRRASRAKPRVARG